MHWKKNNKNQIQSNKIGKQICADKAIDRGERLEDLDNRAEGLANEANLFNKRAKEARRR